MPRVKVARKSTAIDMTAMCDVAFLLLTFFILSAKPKTEDPVPAVIPSATTIAALQEEDMTTIWVSNGKVFVSIAGADLRKQTLKQMSDKYKIPFTTDQINTFAGLESVGVPFRALPGFLDVPSADRAHVSQPGVQVDTLTTNELYNWVHEARVADKYLKNVEMKIAIRGDSKEEYPKIAEVIKTLQKQKVDKFSLITSLKSK